MNSSRTPTEDQVDIPEFRQGVSLTDSGRKVLTPFGKLGNAYDYSTPLHVKLVGANRLIGGAGCAILAPILLAALFGLTTWIEAAGAVLLCLVAVDLLRYLQTRIIFRSTKALDVRREIDRRGNVYPTFLSPVIAAAILAFLVVVEVLFAVAIVVGLLIGSPLIGSCIGGLSFTHALLYLHLWVQSGVRY